MTKRKLGLGGLKFLLPLLAVMVLLLTPMATMAAITSNVTINATPSYISILNAPDNYTFGAVATGSNTSTTADYFNVTSSGSVNTDISIGVNNTEWVGGVVWTHSETAVPGDNIAALWASTDNFSSSHIIVKNASLNDLDTAIVPDASVLWELRLGAPTVFDDGEIKAIQIVLTGSPS